MYLHFLCKMYCLLKQASTCSCGMEPWLISLCLLYMSFCLVIWTKISSINFALLNSILRHVLLLECLLLEQKVLEMRSISLILEERLLTLVMSLTAKQVIEEDLKRLKLLLIRLRVQNLGCERRFSPWLIVQV